MNVEVSKQSVFQSVFFCFFLSLLLIITPKIGCSIELHHANIANKSQAFRQQLMQPSQSITGTWPHITTLSSNVQKITLTGTNTVAAPELLISNSNGNSLSFLLSSSSRQTLTQLQLQLVEADELTSNHQSSSKKLSIRLDNSGAGVALGHWLVFVGALDRWWGPAWQSPLLLSHNARPIPAISIDRIESTRPSTKALSWIGPWRMSSFIGQLESDRVISTPLFWGFRLSMMPVNGLELGLSRTALFGGKGRATNARALYNVITGQDNGEDQPGNQLGSLDIAYRWPSNWSANQLGHEVYMEVAGEDEAGGLPSKKFATIGYSGFRQNQQKQGATWHYMFEMSDTTAGSFGGDDLPHVTYEHHIYQSGYTHYGQAIGSPLGGDTQAITVGLWLDQHQSRSNQAHITGAWLSQHKSNGFDSAIDSIESFIGLHLWTERPCGQLHCSFSIQGFDQPIKHRSIHQQGRYFALNAAISKELK